jgi:hypothetical protein
MSNKAFFIMRLHEHIQYLKKIEATLAGKEDFQGSSHYDCKLGQWLYGTGIQEVADLQNKQAQQIFNSLFEPHERFHQVTKQLLEKQSALDKPSIQLAITEMHKLSQILSQQLLALDALAMAKERNEKPL